MNILSKYGWNQYIIETGQSLNEPPENCARVTSVRGQMFEIISTEGMLQAELLGKLLYASEKEDQPKVGDWVEYVPYGEQALIREVMPRYNALSRKTAGKTFEKQVMVANVDQAVIIQGMDHDFNINRIERYVVQVAACGIRPVLILNKSDLAENPGEFIKEAGRLQRDLTIFTCSVQTGAGLVDIREECFREGITSVLIGSSGVGKSSLVNDLLGTDRKTAEVSEATGKGKHTTTTRDLFLLGNGSIIIDTPGMREFGLAIDDEENLGDLFPAISRFAEDCRYRDCTHVNAQGCNVTRAVEDGELDPLIYENYLKLLKEQQHFQTTSHEKKQQGKQFGKMVREAKEYRRKYKY